MAGLVPAIHVFLLEAAKQDAEGNNHVEIRGQNYFLSADGYLMPAKKGQAPPDLRYFNKLQK
jgi:hypothetical protein